MKKRIIVGACVVSVLAVAAIAIASGDWSGAKDKVERFKGEYENLRKLTPEETRKIVTAVCEADEEERKSVADDAASRVASEVDDKYDDLKDLKDEAIRKLDEVIADDDLKDNHSDAQSYKEDVQKKWDTIERMTNSLRGKNHPVVRFMIDEGNKAHQDRQGSSSYCTVSEYTLDSGRADCIYASSCTVIELKPDNSRAISKGRSQADRYASDLNGSEEARKKLTEKNSDFAHCDHFEKRVDCYKLCPEIDSDTDEMKSTYASWRTDC